MTLFWRAWGVTPDGWLTRCFQNATDQRWGPGWQNTATCKHRGDTRCRRRLRDCFCGWHVLTTVTLDMSDLVTPVLVSIASLVAALAATAGQDGAHASESSRRPRKMSTIWARPRSRTSTARRSSAVTAGLRRARPCGAGCRSSGGHEKP